MKGSKKIHGVKMVSSSNLLDRALSTIKKYSMLERNEKILIGLSGGPDSVCLLYILHSLKTLFNLELYALYIDHCLRPHETQKEIIFCKKVCDNLNIKFATRSINVKTFAKEKNYNIQDAARELRYKIFEDVARKNNLHKIALGHTADDQLETFFMRLFRGSGPQGLSGIPPVRGTIIRPLLEIEREDIKKFLKEKNLNYIQDSSNLKDEYFRNKLRHSLIPLVKKISPHIIKTISKTTDILREEELYFNKILNEILEKSILRQTDIRIELSLSILETMERVMLRRLLRIAIERIKGLRGIEFIHIENIIDLIREGKHGNRINLPKGLRVIKEYSTLVLTSEIPQTLDTSTLIVPGEIVLNDGITLIKATIEELLDKCGDGKKIAIFDADKTGNHLIIRARKNGDFFYPIGFGKKKKLQDYFVDEKVPRDKRDSIPIIAKGNDIIWVAGYRGDERFKISDCTKRFLKIEIKRILR